MTKWVILADVLISVGIVANFFGAWYFRYTAIIKEKPPTVKPFVTPTNRAFTNENKVGQGDSAIVTPKTPQLIDFEEQEELRKMNLPR